MTGPWSIYVSGNGNSGTGAPTDADVLAKAFVENLKANGQSVVEARFCQQTCTDLVTGAPLPALSKP